MSDTLMLLAVSSDVSVRTGLIQKAGVGKLPHASQPLGWLFKTQVATVSIPPFCSGKTGRQPENLHF